MPLTTPDNLFYPDDSSSSDYVQHIQDLAASIQAKLTAQETWTSWTPTFATGTDGGISSVGTGATAQQLGFYRRSNAGSGALIYAEFRFVLGTAPTIVNGTFALNLPVTAYIWGGSGANQTIGSWSLRDNSTSPVEHMGGPMGIYFGTTGLGAHFTAATKATTPFDARYRMNASDPITLASGDILTGHLLYRAA